MKLVLAPRPAINRTLFPPASEISAPLRPGAASRTATVALLLALFGAAPPAHAYQAPNAAAGARPAATSLVVPDSVEAAVDQVFAAYDGTRGPGCAVGVVRSGALVLAKGYGMADLDHGIAIRPATAFEIASVSKQFTAAAVVLLEQDGVLSLEDPVRRWIPELSNLPREVTLRTLLHHTSGVRDYIGLMQTAGRRPEDWYSVDDVIALLARQKALTFAPGTAHDYSNSGYFLLSQVVQRAAGRSLAEYARERLFQPLGMKNTHFRDDPRAVVPNRAQGYGPAPERPHGYRISNSTLPMIGDGGVYTTVEDLALWNRNLDEPAVGGPALVERMLERGVLANGDTLGYALGLRHDRYRGLRTVWHGGAWVGYRANHTRYPDQDMAVFTLCNRNDVSSTALSRRVAEAFLGHLMEPVPAREAVRPESNAPKPLAVAARELERYTGRYHSEELDATYTVRLRGDTLRLAVGGWLEGPMVPVEPGVFLVNDDLTLRFELGSARRPAAFHMDTNWLGVFRFERKD